MSDSTEVVVRALVAAGSIFAAAYLGFMLLQKIAERYSDRYPGVILLVEKARRPFRFLVGIVAARIVSTQIAHVREGWIDSFDHLLQIAMISGICWLTIAAVNTVAAQTIKNDLKKDRDAVDRRRFVTQMQLLRRLGVAFVISIGVTAILLTFPSVRSLGTSLIASAGLISIVAGLAAQTTLTNVFAGIQLALSDSVRVGDVVVVNNQSGTISQLTLTHVELRLWDGRVLILPSSFFISQPFENWTRTRNQIGGSVFMDVDWDTPVEKVRQKVTSVLEGSDLWDGRRNFVLVSNVTGATLQLQIGVSAADTESLFELQSLVREEVTNFLVAQHPESVVRNRTQPMADPSAKAKDASAAPKRSSRAPHKTSSAGAEETGHDDTL